MDYLKSAVQLGNLSYPDVDDSTLHNDLPQLLSYAGPIGFSWRFFLSVRKRVANRRKQVTRRAARKIENFRLPWTWISLSCRWVRWKPQNLILGRWLVDCSSNTQTNVTGSYNRNCLGDVEDISYSSSWGAFAFLFQWRKLLAKYRLLRYSVTFVSSLSEKNLKKNFWDLGTAVWNKRDLLFSCFF